MSSLSENVQQATHDFDAIKDSIEQKGVDVPEGSPTSSYAEKILEIETGITPSGTLPITQNGEYDVAEYAVANVDVDSQPLLDAFIAGNLESVTYNGELVPHRAFQYKKNLKHVYFPNATYIGYEAFYAQGYTSASQEADSFDELSLDTVNAPKVTCVDASAFTFSLLNQFTHGNDLTLIAKSAFAYCKNLKSFDFNEGLLAIYDGAFRDSGLTEFTSPSSLIVLGEDCFAGCRDMKNIDLMNYAGKQLGGGCFWGTSVEYIKLPKTLENISRAAFHTAINEQSGKFSLTTVDLTDFDSTESNFHVLNIESDNVFGWVIDPNFPSSEFKILFKNQQTLDAFTDQTAAIYNIYGNYFQVAPES